MHCRLHATDGRSTAALSPLLPCVCLACWKYCSFQEDSVHSAWSCSLPWVHCKFSAIVLGTKEMWYRERRLYLFPLETLFKKKTKKKCKKLAIQGFCKYCCIWHKYFHGKYQTDFKLFFFFFSINPAIEA